MFFVYITPSTLFLKIKRRKTASSCRISKPSKTTQRCGTRRGRAPNIFRLHLWTYCINSSRLTYLCKHLSTMFHLEHGFKANKTTRDHHCKMALLVPVHSRFCLSGPPLKAHREYPMYKLSGASIKVLEISCQKSFIVAINQARRCRNEFNFCAIPTHLLHF
jgi:hypothetical protein